jgi:hypothetical protein
MALEKIAKGKPQPPKEVKKDTSAFGGRSYLTREQVRGELRKPAYFKATGWRERERVKLEKEIFGPEYGHFIERGEPEKVLKKLEMKKFQARTSTEKSALSKKIKTLRKFLGK